MKITELFLGAITLVVGEEFGNYGRVESITFKGTNHSTHGHVGLPCYIADFDTGIRKIFPHEEMVSITVDKQLKPEVDEDVGDAPALGGD